MGKRYWLRGGIIGLLVGIIYFIPPFYIVQVLNHGNLDPALYPSFLKWYIMPILLLMLGPLGIIILLGPFFIFGCLIGSIYGGIKYPNQVQTQ